MSVVRMDVEIAAQTIQVMGTAMEKLGEAMQSLHSSVEQLNAGWEGAAKANFMAAWDEWVADFANKASMLQPLYQGVATERQQIIDADTSSSFG